MVNGSYSDAAVQPSLDGLEREVGDSETAPNGQDPTQEPKADPDGEPVVVSSDPEEVGEAGGGDSRGQHCYGECRTLFFLWQAIGGQINPLGLEHQLNLGVCIPFIRRPGVLFDYTNLEVGLSSYLSPVYVRQGAYVSWTPLSFVRIRAEAAGAYLWPFEGLASGYTEMRGYDAEFTDTALESAPTRSVWGFTANVGAALKGQLPLTARVALLLFESADLLYWDVGEAPYWYSTTYDLILAAEDYLLKNLGGVLIEVATGRSTVVRIGLVDELFHVPESGYLANTVGLFTQVRLSQVSEGIDLAPQVQVRLHTHHAFRTGLYLFAGLEVFYRL
ncbi:MAG: hypothetical protein JW797_02225 [Bradymonadales bacterium]|nr:hypothetical protein [Bradymonadales bacterium]